MSLIDDNDIAAATPVAGTGTPAMLNEVLDRMADVLDAGLGDAELSDQCQIDHWNLARPWLEWNMVLTRNVIGGLTLTDADHRGMVAFKYPKGLPPLHIIGMQCHYTDPLGPVSAQVWHIPNGSSVARPFSPVVTMTEQNAIVDSLPFECSVIGGDIVQVRADTSSGASPDLSATLRCRTRLVHGV